ncbi:MBL fold metallo-hydrolase [Bordetella genomosp. 13]|uniref:MBL fold metallo-hydrolase n=1 Tax=Bordetella genomosp. 13 TaxID=463040 RepID=A0A1W6ZIC8_9BORD|nr:MBL fold metallo-hydrolase [Bordetella genomosp. 13]ARP97062.1 MBL fold metallo-hydrolase [Bordetella genomosp. 13]
MRLHHLNCISTCPAGGRMMDGRSPFWAWRGRLCCHCVLAELPQGGLALIDTGLGLRDVHDPRSRLSAFFLALVKPEWREAMTAVRQVEALGFRADDVRHIVLTHLDFDHAGGLDDFPRATIHLLRAERDVALARRSWMDRQRFRPQQWSSRQRWRMYPDTQGEDWYGFKRARPLEGLPPDIALVPLPGHTMGHAGVALRGGPTDWLLQAGDAYFHSREMDLDSPGCPPGLRFYQWMLEHDRGARLGNQQRLRELLRRHGGEVAVCSGHDVEEFEQLALHAADTPATRAEDGVRDVPV